LFILCSLLPSVFAENESGLYDIEGLVKLPIRSKFVNGRVLVEGQNGSYTANIRNDGTFIVHSVPFGAYVLDVDVHEYAFFPVRVDISRVGGIRSSNIRTKERLPYPLTIKSEAQKEFFMKREPMNFSGIFKNPMVIMMGVTLIIVVVFPKMMKDMDPKELEEMKKMQKKMNLSNLLKGGASEKTSTAQPD